MTTAQRNRKIKALLAAEFGAEKVWVRGDRGTAYGWVSVYIDTAMTETVEQTRAIKARVWELIKDAGDIEIGTYGYDDPGSDYGYGSKLSIQLRRPWGV